MSSGTEPTRERRAMLTSWVVCVALAAITLAVYGQARQHQFVDFDDIVALNPQIRAGLAPEGIRWAFTSFVLGNWCPLTLLSHMLDVELWGLDAGRHVMGNVALHIANTLLLFLSFRRMTNALWPSALVAGLFALHPLHVESVVWIAERKDVLSTFFWLLAMGAYVRHVARPSVLRYGLTALFLALGLLAKPMLVTLPLVLLLLDVWPLGRFDRRAGASAIRLGLPGPMTGSTPATLARLVFEKVPLFAIAAASCVVTVFAQRSHGAVVAVTDWPLSARIGNAVVTYVAYLGKTFWPVSLSYLYHIHDRPRGTHVLAAAALLLAVTVAALRTVRTRPYVAMGWAWYLITLVPVIGVVQVGAQAMADRYTYVPLVGIFVMLAWSGAELVRWKKHWQVPVASVAAGSVAICGWLTAVQVRVWRDSVALYEHALSIDPAAYFTHANLGHVLRKGGRFDEAEAHYREAVRIEPRFVDAQEYLADLLWRRGKTAESIVVLERAVTVTPGDWSAQAKLGKALLLLGRLDDASQPLREAARLAPREASARYFHAFLLSKQLKHAEAIAECRAALERDAGHEPALRLLAGLLVSTPDESLRNAAQGVLLAEQVRRRSPDPAPELLNWLASVYSAAGRHDEALAAAREAATLADARGHSELARQIRERVEMFEQRHPFAGPLW